MMRRWFIPALCALLLAVQAATAADPATPGDASPAACPVTQPNGNEPPGAGRHPGGYGNDALWTNLWMWGEGLVPVEPNPDRPGETQGPGKWAWYRYIPGELTIEGRRLDGSAPPLRAWIPDYGLIGFQVSGLDFPAPGCWEVTGHAGGESLTFVVQVGSYSLSATPETTP
jgi:hypothetical protein